MHIVDIVLAVLFVFAIIVGYNKGFVSALLTWVGLFASVLMILRYSPMVQAGIMIRFNLSPIISAMIAYLLIFILIMVLFAIVNILINYFVRYANLSPINKIFGAVFGILNMAVMLIIVSFFIEFMPFLTRFSDYLMESVILSEVVRIKEMIRSDIRDLLPLEFFP